MYPDDAQKLERAHMRTLLKTASFIKWSARGEPQQGPGKHFRGAPLGRKFVNFLK